MKNIGDWKIGVASLAVMALCVGCGGGDHDHAGHDHDHDHGDHSHDHDYDHDNAGGGDGAGGDTGNGDAVAAKTDAKPYTLETCIVSGEKLGSMGAPVVRVHEGQEVKFCCESCIEDFEEKPAKFLAKLAK